VETNKRTEKGDLDWEPTSLKAHNDMPGASRATDREARVRTRPA